MKQNGIESPVCFFFSVFKISFNFLQTFLAHEGGSIATDRSDIWGNKAVPRAHLLDQVSTPKMAGSRPTKRPIAFKDFLCLSVSQPATAAAASPRRRASVPRDGPLSPCSRLVGYGGRATGSTGGLRRGFLGFKQIPLK